MEYTYQRAITVTVEDVYGLDNPSIPKGWESTGEFRPPRKGDLYLNAHIEGRVKEALIDWDQSDPRIILRRKKRKQIVLTEVGVGLPKKGQYWEDRGNRVLYMAQEDVCGSWFDAATIYEREDKEV